MERNARESHNARNVICGGGVIIGTKIKQLQRATYLERNANIRQCRTGSLRLPDEIDF